MRDLLQEPFSFENFKLIIEKIAHLNKEDFSFLQLLIVSLMVGIIVFAGMYIYEMIRGKKMHTTQKIAVIATFIYFAFMMYLSVYSRNTINARVMMTKSLQVDEKMNQNVTNVMNVFFFIPWGFLLASIQKKSKKWFLFLITMCEAFLTSLLIESLQYYLKKGYFEFDDLETACIGTAMGIVALFIYRKEKNKRYEEDVI